jgi:protein-tyrosine-phosphatase/predicted ATP-grasp superfamily ATP-dependent carboligase
MLIYPKVLVIGDDTRSFLACVRSLGRQGIEVHAAPYTLDAPALRSRYIKKVHLLPYYLDDGKKWLNAIQALMHTEQYAMVLPCEERGLLPLFVHQADLPGSAVLAIPNAQALDAFFDKLNTRQLAQKCNVPIPKGHVWEEGSNAAQLQAELGFPMVAKLRQSYSLAQLYVRTQVCMLHDAAALDRWLKSHQPEAGTVFFEQVFEGIGLGVSVLCDQGNVLQAFEHHRANELAGSSYYRKSMPLNASRLDAVARMVSAVRYSGLAMFEFKLNTHIGQWVLLEVNARPWGSLPLPVAWGVDFPYRLYQLLCLQQQTPAVPYPVHRFNRNLISDVWQMHALAAQLKGQPATLALALLRWLVGFGRILLLREKQDVLVLDDTAPAWAEFKQFISQRLPGWLAPNANLTNAAASIAKVAATKPRQVLFICQGNICRSPYAERAANSVFNSNGLNITVDSAGMLPRNRRPSPPNAIEAARLHKVDLTKHLSKCTDADLVAKADLIIIFDAINLESFNQRHPDQLGKLVLLSAFDDAGAAAEVADPDGKDVAKFQETYTQIDRCLANLARLLSTTC